VTSHEKEFDGLLRDCIESTLKEVLGEASSATVICHIGSDRLSEGIEFFAEALERIFGAGAHILERLILQKLYSRAEVELEEKTGYEFADYVKETKTIWLSQRKKQETQKRQ